MTQTENLTEKYREFAEGCLKENQKLLAITTDKDVPNCLAVVFQEIDGPHLGPVQMCFIVKPK